MARIAGVDIPRDKRVEVALTYIYGIGLPTAKKILAEANIDGNIRVKDLSEDQVNVIRDIVNNKYLVEGDLRRERPPGRPSPEGPGRTSGRDAAGRFVGEQESETCSVSTLACKKMKSC